MLRGAVSSLNKETAAQAAGMYFLWSWCLRACCGGLRTLGKARPFTSYEISTYDADSAVIESSSKVRAKVISGKR